MTPLQRAWRGGRNDWRLHLLSVFSVAVAFVCLASALLVVSNVQNLQEKWAKSGRASVFLRSGTDKAQALEIERALRETPGVSKVTFVSSEEARHELLQGTRDEEVLAALPAEAFPSSLEVKFAGEVSVKQLDGLQSKLGALPAVESVETYRSWTDKLAGLLSGGVTAAALLALVVLGAVVSVVASTIRMSLQRRSVEVEVLKVIGATDGYVRRPFVIEGAVQGALGATLAIALLAALFSIVSGQFSPQLSLLVGVSPSFLPWTTVLGMIALGGSLGAVAAHASLRKLLSV